MLYLYRSSNYNENFEYTVRWYMLYYNFVRGASYNKMYLNQSVNVQM